MIQMFLSGMRRKSTNGNFYHGGRITSSRWPAPSAWLRYVPRRTLVEDERHVDLEHVIVRGRCPERPIEGGRSWRLAAATTDRDRARQGEVSAKTGGVPQRVRDPDERIRDDGARQAGGVAVVRERNAHDCRETLRRRARSWDLVLHGQE